MFKNLFLYFVLPVAVALSACGGKDGEKKSPTGFTGFWRAEAYCYTYQQEDKDGNPVLVEECYPMRANYLENYSEITASGWRADLVGKLLFPVSAESPCGDLECKLIPMDADHFSTQFPGEQPTRMVFVRVPDADFAALRSEARVKLATATEFLNGLRGKTMIMDKQVVESIFPRRTEKSEISAVDIPDKSTYKEENGPEYVSYSLKMVQFGNKNKLKINGELNSSYQLDFSSSDIGIYVPLSVIDGKLDSGNRNSFGRIEVRGTQILFIQEEMFGNTSADKNDLIGSRTTYIYNIMQ